MKYPTEILPNPKYKLIKCDISSHYLIRFTDSNVKEDIVDTVTNQVKQTQICSPSGQMNDLSTNLLGVFETAFLQIELTQEGLTKYNDYCEPDLEVETPTLITDYIQNSNRGFWVVLIGDIDQTIADYTKGNINTKFKAKCVIQHTPMKWNFWHFSIRWETEDEGFWHELSGKEKNKLAKRLSHEARSNVAKFAKAEEPNYFELDKSCYCK